MDRAKMNKFDMFTRLRDFEAARVNDFPPTSLGGRLFAENRAVIAALTAQGVAQSSGLHAAQQSREGKAAIRDALRREMEMIASTARGMAINTPGLEDKFRLPRSEAEQVWLNAARTFRADATPLKAAFMEQEMPDDFLETLDALIADYEEELVTQHQSTTAHVAARAGIDADIERGMNAARELDPIVRNKYHNDPASLAAWESARHIERVPRKRKKPSGPGSSSDKP